MQFIHFLLLLLPAWALLHSCAEDTPYQDTGLSPDAPLPPFSFQLGSDDSATVLARSTSSTTTTPLDAQRTQTLTILYDLATSLVVNVSQTTYTGLDASGNVKGREWVVTFSNNGTLPTPPLCAIYGVNMSFPDAYGPSGVTEVRRYEGSSDRLSDYTHINSTLTPTNNYTWFYPAGGRSSDATLPFFTAFNSGGRGYTFSIGWSGSWVAALLRRGGQGNNDNNNATQVWVRHDTQDGDCPGICTPLLPGESLATMRVLMVSFPSGTPDSYHLGVNAHRRILVRYKVPRGLQGQVLGAVSSALGWFSLPNCPNLTVPSQLGLVQSIKDSAAIEAYWLDAEYFNGCFPGGVGNWQLPLSAVIDQRELPGGALAALGVAAHASPHPLQYILWVEPERVAPGTFLLTHHPDLLIPPSLTGVPGLLLNLGNATALAYMVDFLTALVAQMDLDVLRLDMNTPPGPNWKATDDTLSAAPGPGPFTRRDGITQVRYNAGLYALWDAVLASRPGLLIDNCASGGRRIDLETLSRSVPLWRSDANALGTPSEVHQVQTMGLSAFAPVHAGTLDRFTPYAYRSAGTLGHTIIGALPPSNDTAGVAGLRAAQAEVVRLRTLSIGGEFFPLTPNALNESWAAWQHHCRGGVECGGVVGGALHIFRRPTATDSPSLALPVFAISPHGQYTVRLSYGFPVNSTRTLSGQDLSPFVATLPDPGTSLLVEYTCTQGCTAAPAEAAALQ